MQLNFLDLIKNHERDDHLTARANGLLEALNESEKKPYEPSNYIQIGNCIVLIAKRGEDCLFNVLDVDGNTPKELTACWRVWSEFKRDLEIIYELN